MVPSMSWALSLLPSPARFVCTMKNLDNLKTTLSTGNLCMKLLQSILVATGALTAMFYLLLQSPIEHKVFSISLTIIFTFLVAWRLLYQRLQKTTNFKSRILILGTSREARKIAEDLPIYQPLGYELKGFIDDG